MKTDKPFDPHKPFQTRGGHKARLLGILKANCPYPIVVAVSHEDGSEYVVSYTLYGKFHGVSESPEDLINTPTPFRYERWANVYPNGEFYTSSSKAEADAASSRDRIACVPVVVEGKEGDGL